MKIIVIFDNVANSYRFPQLNVTKIQSCKLNKRG